MSVLLLLACSFAPAPFSKPDGGYLGIDLLPNRSDLTINGVFVSSPAAEAGLNYGDMLVAIDQVKPRSADDLAAFLRKKKPGDEVTILVQRGSETVQVKVRLTAPFRAHLGIWFQGSTLTIGQLVPNAAASKAGLLANDTLLAFDGKKITTPAALIALLKGKKPGATITLTIRRNNEEKKVAVRLGRRPGY